MDHTTQTETYTITLDLADVEFELTCEPEHASVRGNFMCSGDDEQDKADEDAVIEALENGNQWAWCCVCVTATVGVFTGRAYLGCVSDESEESFRKGCADYVESLQQEALDDLRREIKIAGGRLVGS